jgi:hypothetical protein
VSSKKIKLPAQEEARELQSKGMSERDAILTSMKRTKKDVKKAKTGSLCGPCDTSDAYPYGLEVRLEEESLDKLGIEEMPKAGTKMTLTAEVEVSGSSSSARMGENPRRSLTLQITKMALE